MGILAYGLKQYGSIAVTKKAKLIVCSVTLVGSCLFCVLLWPYIWYASLVTMFNSGAQSRMRCWVKVVDQHGIGVRGYKLEVTEHGVAGIPLLSKKTRLRNFYTNAAGMFRYDSEVPIGKVFFGHCNTQWEIDPSCLIEQHTLAVYAFKLDQRKKANPRNYLGSEENPFTIHVYCVGRPQRMLYWYKRVHLTDKNAYACLDILQGTISESENATGDIAISDGVNGAESHSECGMRFVAGNGCSLYPVVDDWGLEAPESQYIKNLCWAKDWMLRKTQAYNRVQVYFRLRDTRQGKRVYGKIDCGDSRNIDNATIQCYANIQGSRSLYFRGYEKSVMTFAPGQIEDYISPPVSLLGKNHKNEKRGKGSGL